MVPQASQQIFSAGASSYEIVESSFSLFVPVIKSSHEAR